MFFKRQANCDSNFDLVAATFVAKKARIEKMQVKVPADWLMVANDPHSTCRLRGHFKEHCADTLFIHIRSLFSSSYCTP